ncbi:MAG: putative HMP/thiamine import ATP-binding protein YkoD, partial [Actinomycetota bacterium]
VQQGVDVDVLTKRVHDVARRFHLDTKANLLELSSGWQQRVAIAASLSSGAGILLLDEPFSALDDLGTKQLLETLEGLKASGVTVIIAEHRIAPIASLVDKCLKISEGKIIEIKPHTIPLESNISSGKVTALIGDNGSGKTTYLQKLAKESGVLVPQPASDLLFLDTVIAELAQADLDAGTQSGTAGSILSRFQAEIDESQNPRDLSEGQKLLLALSIQLAKRSELLLLDEPTLGLDGPNRQALVNIIGELANQGTEVLVATHDREFANSITNQTVEVSSVRQ